MGKHPHRGYTDADEAGDESCAQTLRAWNRCHGAFYQAAESDLRWNLTEQKTVRYRAAELAGVPVIYAEAAAEGVALGIPEKWRWVSLYGEITGGMEAAFAEAAEESARRDGKTRLAIGSDEFHFLPGIPVDEPAGQALAEALVARGFSTRASVDYVGRIANPACRAYVQAARDEAARRGWSLRLVESAEDREELTALLARGGFSARWRREWNFQNEREDTARTFWNLLRDETGRVLGFSRLAKRGRLPDPGKGWTPGAMRLQPVPGAGFRNTDSCLGPIGIDSAERGRGAGKILLGLSLHELSLQNVEVTCIDWTDAYNYYTPLELSLARRYLSAWKEF